MELHRLDGLPVSGLDHVDIHDIDFEEPEEGYIDFSGLGYVQDPDIAYEILDEYGNVVMYADAEENLYSVEGLDGLFKKIGKGLKKATKAVKKAVVKPVVKSTKFVAKKVIKPVATIINKINPAAILLRNGFLLAMKVNLMKVAEKLRFGYLSETEARKRGMDMGGFAKVKKAVNKAEDIYKTAGGNPKNLKKAILSGKGNDDKSVPLQGFGLGAIEDDYADEMERFITEADADEVLSIAEGTSAVDGLGVVASGAMAAASGAVATVSALLSKITGVFDKVKEAKNTVTSLVDKGASVIDQGKQLVNIQSHASSPQAVQQPAVIKTVPVARSLPPSNIPPSNSLMSSTSTTNEVTTKSWASRNKIILLGGGVVLLAGGTAAYFLSKRKKTKTTRRRTSKSALNGVGSRKKTANTNKRSKTKLTPTVLL